MIIPRRDNSADCRAVSRASTNSPSCGEVRAAKSSSVKSSLAIFARWTFLNHRIDNKWRWPFTLIGPYMSIYHSILTYPIGYESIHVLSRSNSPDKGRGMCVRALMSLGIGSSRKRPWISHDQKLNGEYLIRRLTVNRLENRHVIWFRLVVVYFYFVWFVFVALCPSFLFSEIWSISDQYNQIYKASSRNAIRLERGNSSWHEKLCRSMTIKRLRIVVMVGDWETSRWPID